MGQMIKIIRKVDIEKQYKELLLKEQDYELASLFQAMQNKDEVARAQSNKRLAEIHQELEGLRAYA